MKARAALPLALCACAARRDPAPAPTADSAALVASFQEQMQAHGRGDLAPQAPPAACADLVPLFERLGEEMYRRDQAAWIATDAIRWALQEDERLAPGWVVVPEEGGAYVVHWVTVEGGDPRSVYRVRTWPGQSRSVDIDTLPFVDSAGAPLDLSAGWPGSVSLGRAPPEPLPEEGMRQYRALQVAMAQPFQAQAESYNFAIVPTPEWYFVYLLPATTDPDVILLGGAISYLVRTSDLQLDQVMEHSSSILRLPRPVPAAGELLAGVFAYQPRYPCPLETHVFASFTHQLPLYIGTDLGLWYVHGGSIEFLGLR